MELNKIYQGHVIDVLKGMPEQSVDCVITSPPYWSLRDYKVEPQVWDDGWRGSLGLEPTMALFLDHLLQVFDEVRRVLKDTGTMFINIGDSYWNAKGSCFNPGGGANSLEGKKKGLEAYPLHRGNKSDNPDLRQKSLCGIPERFVIAMTDRQWIRRNTLIWHKPNPMPSSATDRFTVDFEPVYFFTKQGKYWFERQFEAHKRLWDKTNGGSWSHPVTTKEHGQTGYAHSGGYPVPNPQGRNKRCVWTIPTFPFPGSHFATFPPKLVEPMILSGCPEYVCSKCGVGRSKVMERGELVPDAPTYKPRGADRPNKYVKKITAAGMEKPTPNHHYEYQETGLADCGCGAPFNPGVVMDIFMGAGTVGVVAQQHRRNWVGVELNPEYIEMAEKRIAHPNNSQVKLL